MTSIVLFKEVSEYNFAWRQPLNPKNLLTGFDQAKYAPLERLKKVVLCSLN